MGEGGILDRSPGSMRRQDGCVILPREALQRDEGRHLFGLDPSGYEAGRPDYPAFVHGDLRDRGGLTPGCPGPRGRSPLPGSQLCRPTHPVIGALHVATVVARHGTETPANPVRSRAHYPRRPARDSVKSAKSDGHMGEYGSEP